MVVALPHSAAIIGTAPLVGRAQHIHAMLYTEEKLPFELPHLAISGCDFQWVRTNISIGFGSSILTPDRAHETAHQA